MQPLPLHGCVVAFRMLHLRLHGRANERMRCCINVAQALAQLVRERCDARVPADVELLERAQRAKLHRWQRCCKVGM